MSIRNTIAAGCIVLSLSLLTDCATRSPAPTPSPSPLCAVNSGMVTCYTGLVECLNEKVPVAPECNELFQLPWCPAEDDVIDGTKGSQCFWKDPSTGDLWYNDGNGYLD